MPEVLPPKKNLPDAVAITVGGNNPREVIFAKVSDDDAVKWGMCRKNEKGLWVYYIPSSAVARGHAEIAMGGTASVGARRHFSICYEKGRESVHVSLKDTDGDSKRFDPKYPVQIWFNYGSQKGQPSDYYETDKTYYNANIDRINKASGMLQNFVKALTKHQTGSAAVQAPPFHSYGGSSGGSYY